MNEIIKYLIAKKPVPDSLLSEALYEICDVEHAGCNDCCPVYKINGSKPVNGHLPFGENRGCDTFKNGALMLKFLRESRST